MGKKHIRRKQGFYEKYIKRVFDVVCSAVAIIILSPLMGATALLIRIKLGSPVIFCQPRPGKDDKIFMMYKFRSMTDERDTEGNLLPDERRLTAFGKKLRSTSLDELPELFNILKGDMSIVGPRPQLVRDMVFMTPEQRARHGILPGLTGLAQVNGRNSISWEEKFRWDLHYIKHISFRTDILIILKTVGKVLKKEDIATTGMETSIDYGDYLLSLGKVDYTTYLEKQREAEGLIK